ncbi:hypothetical protein E2C01_066427 [Portunus trituberculatus]|uniref:Uncharacterized protein n=1 Tax=Portunus trituberculatus TaxID=210409 RepID=A0A5B7HPR1_PORTR|nr:hypothetical protein [Portunus trituberculatus]
MAEVVVTFAICLAPLACGFGLAYNLTKNPSEILGPHLGPWKTYVYFLAQYVLQKIGEKSGYINKTPLASTAAATAAPSRPPSHHYNSMLRDFTRLRSISQNTKYFLQTVC